MKQFISKYALINACIPLVGIIFFQWSTFQFFIFSLLEMLLYCVVIIPFKFFLDKNFALSHIIKLFLDLFSLLLGIGGIAFVISLFPTVSFEYLWDQFSYGMVVLGLIAFIEILYFFFQHKQEFQKSTFSILSKRMMVLHFTLMTTAIVVLYMQWQSFGFAVFYICTRFVFEIFFEFLLLNSVSQKQAHGK
jgi:hypothetical protein